MLFQTSSSISIFLMVLRYSVIAMKKYWYGDVTFLFFVYYSYRKKY